MAPKFVQGKFLVRQAGISDVWLRQCVCWMSVYVWMIVMCASLIDDIYVQCDVNSLLHHFLPLLLKAKPVLTYFVVF